jgi:hypothetical protein
MIISRSLENKNEGNQRVMVPRGGIEPPTRGFSMDVSSLTLCISITYINSFLMCYGLCYRC